MKHFTFAFRRNERTLLVALKDKTQFELVKLVIHRDWSLHSALRVRGGGGEGGRPEDLGETTQSLAGYIEWSAIIAGRIS